MSYVEVGDNVDSTQPAMSFGMAVLAAAIGATVGGLVSRRLTAHKVKKVRVVRGRVR